MSFRFGLFTFDAATQQLLRQGVAIALEPQPARALSLLLARHGEVVTRDELRQAIWDAETHVDFDRGMAYVLSQIRSALQDSAANPRFVQTIPRQGYKFIAPVEGMGAVLHPAEPWWTRSRIIVAAAASAAGLLRYSLLPPDPTRLAVSVFDNETGLPELDRFVNSLSDSVVTALTNLDAHRLAIIGNAAPLRRPRNLRNLKSLARELGTDYVILGQLQKQDSSLRFVTHLIRLPGETHLKANRLYGDAQNLGALESEILNEYVRAVQQHVLKRPLK